MQTRSIVRAFFFAALANLALPGSSLAQQEETDKDPGLISSGAKVSGQVVSQTGRGLGNAALAPLDDLNLRRDHIPPEFDAFTTPYDPIENLSCDGIARNVRLLDTLLEPDVDVQIELARRAEEKEDENSERNDKIASKTSGFALGTIASEARSLIPFRGVVRHATGANAHEKRYNAAYEKAYLRRSFLKGLGLGMGCTYPAAPLAVTLPEPQEESAPITYRGSRPD